MHIATYELTFDGGFLRRGFWLYAWEVTTKTGARVYYVGRTGDSSSVNAQSPFARMGQNLGFAENSNMVRRHLRDRDIDPEQCRFRLVAVGPIHPESDELSEHRARRDDVGAMEKALAEEMAAAGYDVMNTVRTSARLDEAGFERVREAFASAFSALAAPVPRTA